MERQTYNINWTPLRSYRPQFWGKCIAALDPQTGNIFVLISSVGVQHCDAFIRFQKFPRMTSQTHTKKKRPADNWKDEQTEILYCHSGDLNPWHTAKCAERNYELRKWTFSSNLNQLSRKLPIKYIWEKPFILQWFIWKNHLKILLDQHELLIRIRVTVYLPGYGLVLLN